MKVFVSWSGARSKAIAKVLHECLPKVIQATEPWLSESDIPPGSWWRSELFRELADASFAIICLSPENLNSAWLHFEAGVIAREVLTKKNAAVYTFLLNLSHADVKGPLAEFQHTRATEEETRRLLADINQRQERPLKDTVWMSAFDTVWAQSMKPAFDNISEKHFGDPEQRSVRESREVLDEVLERVRALGAQFDAHINRINYLPLLGSQPFVFQPGNDPYVVSSPQSGWAKGVAVKWESVPTQTRSETNHSQAPPHESLSGES